MTAPVSATEIPWGWAPCPVCRFRNPVGWDRRMMPHPWVAPVYTFSLFGQTSVLEYRGWCPGEGLKA